MSFRVRRDQFFDQVTATKIVAGNITAKNIAVSGDITVNGGLNVVGGIVRHFDKDHLTATIPAKCRTKNHNIDTDPSQANPLAFPLAFFDAPLVPNPLVYGTDYSVCDGNLVVTPFTNNGDVPWYFLDLTSNPQTKAPVDPAGTRVLFCGIPDSFIPNPGGPGGPNPPVDGRNGVCRITNPSSTLVATFTLKVRSSTEPAYDFATVARNGITVYSASGAGPSINDPYITGEIRVTMSGTTTLDVRFAKDTGWYAGLDNIYVYITDIVFSTPPTVPTVLAVYRDDVPVLYFDKVVNLDTGVPQHITITKDFTYLPHDEIRLSFDPTAYSDFKIDFSSTI